MESSNNAQQGDAGSGNLSAPVNWDRRMNGMPALCQATRRGTEALRLTRRKQQEQDGLASGHLLEGGSHGFVFIGIAGGGGRHGAGRDPHRARAQIVR